MAPQKVFTLTIFDVRIKDYHHLLSQVIYDVFCEC